MQVELNYAGNYSASSQKYIAATAGLDYLSGLGDHDPSWFNNPEVRTVERQPDHASLIKRAEALWPYLDWMSSELVDSNRVKWYVAVAKQRKTATGWVMDRGSKAPNWGSGSYPSPQAAH